MNTANRIPVTVLTGYLGAGKTTLLNRILSQQHGRRYAVIVNEFGEIGIDAELILNSDEELFEMNNGCICCTVRGDLIRTVHGLLATDRSFDGILVETTGLADPGPVAQTFLGTELRGMTRLDSIVTLVDCANYSLDLFDSQAAYSQIAQGDVIVLDEEVVGRVEADPASLGAAPTRHPGVGHVAALQAGTAGRRRDVRKLMAAAKGSSRATEVKGSVAGFC
jgi:hypothetical protein